MSNSLSKIAQEVVFQTVGGLLIGTAADHIFEPQLFVFDGNLVKVAGETALQLGITGIATAAWYEFLFKRGVRGEVGYLFPFLELHE